MRWSSPLVLIALTALSVTSCTHPVASDTLPESATDPADLERAPAESRRIEVDLPVAPDDIDNWFASRDAQRVYVQLDRPMYKPGEAVWIKSWSVSARAFSPNARRAITYELVDPQGQVLETKRVMQNGGKANNDFVLDANAPGGKWLVRATLPSGEIDERPFIVSNYQAPRINKELEFLRQAYGPGDRVEALVELERGTGGALANHAVHALLQVDGRTLFEADLTTDDAGAVVVGGDLPAALTSGDGLLTVLVEDAGITESISRSVPIVLADLNLDFFPEGGELVEGLPSRVYFEGTDRHGEPADIEGFVADDTGRRVATFSSLHDGMGRLAFTPKKGRSYKAHITAPAGVSKTYALPGAQAEGCVLRSYDDIHGERSDVRVGVRCSEPTDVAVVGFQRDRKLDAAGVRATPDREAVVYLKPDAEMKHTQGAVRVTVFAEDVPLAERLVYRNPGKDLQIAVSADKDEYSPRDRVKLDVRTLDPAGEPIAAEVALAVVDDGVLRLADDEEGHMLSRLYLEPDLVESPEDPGWYFDRDEELAHRGLDLVMGVRGYRTFEWQAVWDGNLPAPVAAVDTGMFLNEIGYADDMDMEELIPMAAPAMEGRRGPRLAMPNIALRKNKAPRAPMAPPPAVPAPQPAPPPAPAPVVAQVPMDPAPMGGGMPGPVIRADKRLEKRPEKRPVAKQARKKDRAMKVEAEAWHGPVGRIAPHARQGWAVARVFPAPDYSAGFTGTRTDFRDTVLWAPSVVTDAKGKGEVSFYLSDAVTSFRVTAEGVGGGYAGHSEETLSSVLPVSIATKLPTAISAGDRLDLPIIVSNTRSEALDVAVDATFDSSLITATNPGGASLNVPAQDGATYWMPLEIGQGSESAKLTLTADGGGVSDTVEHTLDIVPPGFPRAWSTSGESVSKLTYKVRIDDLVDDTLTASVQWHPSPVSSLMEGMEGLIREPGGCFEQTSSTNWPNVAILNYLEAHDGDPKLRLKSGRALDVGYQKLTGYQVDAGGFETWGSGPGKEVLSAFGLLQFRDMSNVYPVDPSILTRDVEYLLAQRDGKGGFKNTGESAHGYGSAPKPVLDGFITWSLVSTGNLGALESELAQQERVAKTSEDPYVLALAARTLLAADNPKAKEAVTRLAAMQAEDGSFPGAESSITRSYEANLLVESTALASLALMDAGGHNRATDKAAEWLQNARRGGGTWGATQATALALGALTAHAEHSKRPRSGGTFSVEVNGKRLPPLVYEADDTDTLEIADLERYLREGDNTIVLRHDGASLPFTLDVGWTALNPESAPGAELSLQTRIDRHTVKMGETVRLSAHVENETNRVVPSPIARIRIPAGLEAQTWQLEEMQDRGEIAFFETRPREVTLYWDGLEKGGAHDVDLDLVAFVPGAFTGPASSAYPYYNDDEKAWDRGLAVEVKR